MKFDKSDKYYLQDIVAENVVACIVMPEEWAKSLKCVEIVG